MVYMKHNLNKEIFSNIQTMKPYRNFILFVNNDIVRYKLLEYIN